MYTIRMKLFLMLAALIWPSMGSLAQEFAPGDHENFHLFLLAGQSNMAGRGKIADQDQQVHPRVWMLNQAGIWKPAVAPLHFDKPKLVGVGLGRTFALDYAEANPDVIVGLVPCAVGGSPIRSWKVGGFHEQTRTHPFDDARKRVEIAKKQGVFQGILWHQGESDCKPELVPRYRETLI